MQPLEDLKEMDNNGHDDGNIAKNGHVGANENNADWHWLDNAIYGSTSGPLGFEEAYEMVPAKHQSIDELVKWVSDAIRYDTGLKLSRNQERIILHLMPTISEQTPRLG
jgi:hypothetical protein